MERVRGFRKAQLAQHFYRHARGGAVPQCGERVRALVGRRENVFEMPCDAAAVLLEFDAQRGEIGVARRGGDQRLVLFHGRQRLRLLVVEILQAVFEIAQENVGGGEFVYCGRRQQVARFE